MLNHLESVVLRKAALQLRSELREGRVTPATFRAVLAEIAPRDRDQLVDLLWGIDEIAPDDPELPRGCVPYLPCPVASVLAAIQQAGVTSEDVFVDVGSGAGRVVLVAHLETGASCIGLEIQPALAATAQGRADWLHLNRVRFVGGDAARTIRSVTSGTVFFLYCPFSGERLRHFLAGLEDVARTRPIRVCCVDMPLLEAPWLIRLPPASSNIDVYRSTACSASRPE